MVQAIRNLRELLYQGGSIQAVCDCGKIAIFAPYDLSTFFTAKGLNDGWPAFAKHLKCSACGARSPRVSWSSKDPPPRDPRPPAPRFERKGEANVIDLKRERQKRSA